MIKYLIVFSILLSSIQTKEIPKYIQDIHRKCIENTIEKYLKLKGCSMFAAIHIASFKCDDLIKRIKYD